MQTTMTPVCPAALGMPFQDVDTPALLLDLRAFERNLAKMAAAARQAGVALRPHAKSHKSPDIAHRQIAGGAVGVCCQKVSEAEAMIVGGVRDILVSNEIVGTVKLNRLARLAGTAHISVCVDDPNNVADLSAAMVRHSVTVDVLVELNVGARRCGVPPGEPALELARMVARSPGLRFAGLQGYCGTAQHIADYQERKRAIDHTIAQCRITRELLASNGLECRTITGGGTGSYEMEAASAVYTEVQPGSYIFMDAAYARNRSKDGSPFRDFDHILFVYSTIMSTATRDAPVLDAGLKAIGVDAGMPRIWDLSGAQYLRASDEHGTLQLPPGTHVKLGEKLRLVTGNCDPTVNLHDWFVGVRDGRVTELWPITGRGAGL
jgi:3-hydroxy-D-aspartate aldolase